MKEIEGSYSSEKEDVKERLIMEEIQIRNHKIRKKMK